METGDTSGNGTPVVDRPEPDSPANSDTLGAGIRRERIKQGLNLAQLGERVHLTVSALSQIERGANDPSLSALRRIADALEVPVFQLLLDREPPSVVVRRPARKEIVFPGGTVTYQLVSAQAARSFEILEFELGPSESASFGRTVHKNEECLVVLEGSVTAELGETAYELGVGDSIVIYPNLPHRITSAGTEAARVLSVLSPPTF